MKLKEILDYFHKNKTKEMVYKNIVIGTYFNMSYFEFNLKKLNEMNMFFYELRIIVIEL